MHPPGSFYHMKLFVALNFQKSRRICDGNYHRADIGEYRSPHRSETRNAESDDDNLDYHGKGNVGAENAHCALALIDRIGKP